MFLLNGDPFVPRRLAGLWSIGIGRANDLLPSIHPFIITVCQSSIIFLFFGSWAIVFNAFFFKVRWPESKFQITIDWFYLRTYIHVDASCFMQSYIHTLAALHHAPSYPVLLSK